jgi:Zn-dependent protease with chaperone function
MNIRAQRFATKTRTWLLIAGLTALLIGIGALIGGAWLYIFVFLALAMNVGGCWFSDRLALQASRAKRVEPGTRPYLEAIVQDLARRAELPVPRLFVNPATASLYIVNPLRRQGMTTLFSTHPPIAERVRRLRALDADQSLRRAA